MEKCDFAMLQKKGLIALFSCEHMDQILYDMEDVIDIDNRKGNYTKQAGKENLQEPENKYCIGISKQIERYHLVKEGKSKYDHGYKETNLLVKSAIVNQSTYENSTQGI